MFSKVVYSFLKRVFKSFFLLIPINKEILAFLSLLKKTGEIQFLANDGLSWENKFKLLLFSEFLYELGCLYVWKKVKRYKGRM
jgi:hypothetical protein